MLLKAEGPSISVSVRGGTAVRGAAPPPAPVLYVCVGAGSSGVAVGAHLVWEQRQIAVRSDLLAGMIHLHSSALQKVERGATAVFTLGTDLH